LIVERAWRPKGIWIGRLVSRLKHPRWLASVPVIQLVPDRIAAAVYRPSNLRNYPASSELQSLVRTISTIVAIGCSSFPLIGAHGCLVLLSASRFGPCGQGKNAGSSYEEPASSSTHCNLQNLQNRTFVPLRLPLVTAGVCTMLCIKPRQNRPCKRLPGGGRLATTLT